MTFSDLEKSGKHKEFPESEETRLRSRSRDQPVRNSSTPFNRQNFTDNSTCLEKTFIRVSRNNRCHE